MNDRENLVGLLTRICPTLLHPSRTHFKVLFLFLQFGQAGQSQRKQRMWESGKRALSVGKISRDIVCF